MVSSAIGVAPEVARFKGSPEEWDAALVRLAGWTHFHRYGWKAIIEEILGHQCEYLVERGADGEVCGLLPLAHVRSALFGRYLVSMPFLNYGGPLGPDDTIKRLTDQAVALAHSTRPKLLELRSRVPLPVGLPVSHRKITVLLDLPEGDPDVLWSKLGSKLRSQIKRPRKEGVEVRIGGDQVDAFYHVFARHMRDLGTPALPKRFFRAIAEAFPEDAWFACAYHQGAPIACGAGFRWDREFEITWASALLEHKRLAANMLVYWSLMEKAVAEGVEVFNFGRCTPGGGTHRFKKQWRGRDQQLWWYHYPEEIATPSPDDGRYAWGPRLWRHLPLSIATALGPRIVRGIP